jgi:DNA-binding IscR family transcriptional regulator
MWRRIERAIYAIYDETTIQDLINNERFPDAEDGDTRDNGTLAT